MQTARNRDQTASRAGVAPPGWFAVEIRPWRERVIAALCGELDCATVAQLESTIDDLVGAGWDSIVLDLRPLRFIDSTGLCAIARLTDRVDVAVQLIDGPPAVARVFDLTGLRPLLPFIQPSAIQS